jgi:hypothetical protein
MFPLFSRGDMVSAAIRLIGHATIASMRELGRIGWFLIYSLYMIVRRPGSPLQILKQIRFIGAKSLFVIFLTAAFTGMVLGLQGYYTLAKFGSEGMLGTAVALSLIRELGPVLTALMVTGRAGSAITAEIGIMRITEQIDALETMALDPFKYLITPKFIAAMLSLPLLCRLRRSRHLRRMGCGRQAAGGQSGRLFLRDGEGGGLAGCLLRHRQVLFLRGDHCLDRLLQGILRRSRCRGRFQGHHRIRGTDICPGPGVGLFPDLDPALSAP